MIAKMSLMGQCGLVVVPTVCIYHTIMVISGAMNPEIWLPAALGVLGAGTLVCFFKRLTLSGSKLYLFPAFLAIYSLVHFVFFLRPL